MESDVQTTPGWVRDLEKKRGYRPHKLAHEVGAGAPCLSCGDACPGLDLHFWRKSCRNCKCSREKHDVVEEQGYEQFEILLGAGHKNTLKKTYQLNIGGDQGGDHVASAGPVTFDWVPPGISPDVAEGYMLGLPANQRPVSGSAAAQRRREQLERQVPLHDVDPSRCHSLSDAEISGFENYRQHLKEGAVGQGRVATLAAMLKELRLPYAIQTQEAVSKNISTQPQKLEPLMMNNNDESFPPPPSPQTLSSLGAPEFPSPPPPLPTTLPPFMQRPSAFLPKPYQPLSDQTAEHGGDVNKNITNYGNQPGQFANNQYLPSHEDITNHGYQNVRPAEAHEILGKSQPQMFGVAQQGGVPPMQGYDRSSLGLQFPAPMPMIEEVRSPGCEGELSGPVRAARYDNNNATGELPGQLAALQLTDPAGNSNACCAQCAQTVAPGDVVVTADRAGPGVFWHPACFVCSSCKELLVDLIYFHKDNKLFCGRHFAEEVNIPRCAACDELIFTTEYTLAEEQHFHVRHFCCIECDVPLAGMKYISREGQPCCLDCYQKLHSKACTTCKRLIGPSESSVIWQHLHWHADPKCFRCAACQKSLLSAKFAVKDEHSLCSKECIQAFLSQRATAL